MKKLSLIAVVVTSLAAAAACGGSDKKEETTPQPQPEPEPAAPFPEIKLYEGETHVLTVREDGVVIRVDSGGHVATINPDMTLQVVNGPAGALAADGTITFDGQPLPAKIGSEGTINLPDGGVVKLEDDGSLTGQNANSKPWRIVGATTPESKRAALFLLVLSTLQAPKPEAEKGCGDGSALVCEMVPTPCAEGLVHETVKGCFGRCVDPTTCAPPPGAEPKKKKKGK